MTEPAPAGGIAWTDLTVPDAAAARDFYAAVTGMGHVEVEMEGYSDFSMIPAGAEAPAAGVCFARGENASLPPVWLVYFAVEDIDAAVKEALSRGGSVITGPKDAGGAGRFAALRGIAGEAFALWQSASPE